MRMLGAHCILTRNLPQGLVNVTKYMGESNVLVCVCGRRTAMPIYVYLL